MAGSGSLVSPVLRDIPDIALANPNAGASKVTLKAYSAEGKKTGEKVVDTAPCQLISQLLSELIPSTNGQIGGYILV